MNFFFSNSASNNLEQVIINLSLCILLANKPVKTTPKHNNQVLFQNHDIMISCVIRPDIIPSSHLGFRNFTIPNVLYIHPTCFSNPLYLWKHKSILLFKWSCIIPVLNQLFSGQEAINLTFSSISGSLSKSLRLTNKEVFFLAHGKKQEIFQDRSFVCFWGYVFLAFNAKVDIYLHFLMSLSTEKNIVN